jgi:TonB family protein
MSLRNEFETMHSRKGSYDARPRGSGPDTYDVDTIVQVPASKEGMASGNVLYDLEVRFEGEHSVMDMSAAAAAASEKLQVLEHDDGGEEPLSAQVPVAVEFEQRMNEALKSLLPFDAEYGLDMRGRQFHQDVEDYLMKDMRTLAHANVQALSTELGVTPGSPTNDVQSALAARFGPRMVVLQNYWALVPSLRANRDLWEHFLSLNHMPGNTAHNTSVQVAEATLRADLGRTAPEDSWVAASKALIQAYVNERANLAKAGPENRDAPWRARESPCPEAAAKTSGSPRPVMKPVAKGPAEYYPVRLQHLGVEGTVVLNVRVAASGCVVASAVRSSSGAEQLDRAAQEWIENVSYLPAENHQQAIESFAPVAVAFKLED